MGESSKLGRPVRLEQHFGTTHLVLRSPILDQEVLADLASHLKEIAAGPQPRPVVLRSAHPTVFLAGAHLREISVLDATNCVGYAARGRLVARLLDHHPAVTVAAVHGSCSGGGFDLALSCDAIVAGPRASFDHPGVRRGLVTGWSGTIAVRAALGASPARATFIEGCVIDARTAAACGLVSLSADDPAAAATRYALELARLEPSRIELWRGLRGPDFVDRFRASMVHK